MKPLIGITMNLLEEAARDLNVLDLDYGRAVAAAGGIPLPVPGIDASIPDLVKRLDGFVLSGGDDISPSFYRERPLPGANLTLSPDRRTRFEMKLFRAARKAGKPILAICGGAQLANIALGGSLYQDIPLQFTRPIQHSVRKKGEKIFHPVSVLDGTLLEKVLDPSRIRVRSSHHQSIKNPGCGIQLSALAGDGVVEAFEGRKGSFLIAVQWHPEKTPNDRATKKLFRALVAAASRR
ncbi:MAG: hypothetical protein A2X56_07855 [Nitrospirae bacterium GWC2_57_13]|nr:MAG: hypothetical protein A2X56_07855 [Nitrospirae bacterium GWC2_57_13]